MDEDMISMDQMTSNSYYPPLSLTNTHYYRLFTSLQIEWITERRSFRYASNAAGSRSPFSTCRKKKLNDATEIGRVIHLQRGHLHGQLLSILLPSE